MWIANLTIIGTTKHIRIENCWIERCHSGIYVSNVASGTTTIANNTCTNNNDYGISLENSDFSTVANNTCANNDWHGISLEYSASSTVTNNTCNNNSCGISLWVCTSPTVTNNTCNNNYYDGISLAHSGSSTVTNNTCNNNHYDGISLEYSGSSTVTNNTCNNNHYDGISLERSSFSTVANNTCNDNGGIGIFLGSSDYNYIAWSTLVGNGGYGIELSDESDDNFIHQNDFIANGQDTSQACDNGTNNQWYDETVLEGNYWSDYSGTGSYLIAGSAGTSDPYPSLSPYRYTSSSSSPTFLEDVLVRIGLFLGVIGLVVVVFFINRRKISS
jgi:parallel beta-helix repeat protein